MANWMRPEKNAKKMAYETSVVPSEPTACDDTISDMIAVGPRVMSLAVPSSMYTSKPMNEE